MRDFDGPQEFLESLREADIITKPSSLLYVQALKFLETKATPPAARRARARAARSPGDAQALMQGQGQPGEPSNLTGPMPATDDEIREKYLERAIREINALTRDLQSCRHCPRGNLMPVLGSGHPQADVFLLKYAPQASEVEEGVAFYGRCGAALMKSLQAAGIDPLAVYGTLCVKCPVADPALADPAAWRAWSRSWRSCSPKHRGRHGRGRAGRAQRPRRAARPAAGRRAGRRAAAHAVDRRARSCPNIDEALDEEAAKRAFWSAFRVLGDWYAELPPY